MELSIDEMLNKLEKESKKTGDELNAIKERERILKLKETYSGEDEVIDSETAWKDWQANKKTNYIKVKTKIPMLDDIIDGFREGNLIVVSAPTKQGKTTLCQTFTANFAKEGWNCLWFSYEVSVGEFLEKFNDKVPLFFLPKQLKENTLLWIETKIVEAIAKFNTKIIFIDHLHYIINLENINRNINTSLYIGSVMRELKKIAIRWNVIIFVICHITKTALDKPPELGDLRDSSFIAQEADIVMFLWRMMRREREMPVFLNESILSVQANRRTGKTGIIKLGFKDNMFFEMIDEKQVKKVFNYE